MEKLKTANVKPTNLNNALIAVKIEGQINLLNGETQTLKRYLRQYQRLLEMDLPSGLDTLVMVEHSLSGLSETENLLLNMLDRMKILTSTLTASLSITETEVILRQMSLPFEDIDS